MTDSTAAPMRRARTYADLTATMHHFDSERYRWLADQLRDAGCDRIARLADKWAAEHRTVAANLMRAGGE